MVYFFQGIETGNIKIGYTAGDPLERLRQISSSDILLCLAVIKEAYTDAHYHRQFRHLWLHGEWFSPGHDLLTFIDSLPDNEYTGVVQEELALGIDTGYAASGPACYRLCCGSLKCTNCDTPLPEQEKAIRAISDSGVKDAFQLRIKAEKRGIGRCHKCFKGLPYRAYWHVMRWKSPETIKP